MASIRDEYQRFLTALAGRPVAEDVRRMANLVFNNLKPLAEVVGQLGEHAQFG